MKEVASDIISIKFKNSDTLSICMKKFYDVMRKHGIKEGDPAYNDDGKDVGRTMFNPDWIMCLTLFQDNLKSHIMWSGLLGKTPKDLQK